MTDRDRVFRDIVREANLWRIKLSRGDLEHAERQAFETWLEQDAQHEAVYDQAETYWSAYDYLSDGDIEADLLKPSFSEHVTSALDAAYAMLRRPSFGVAMAALAVVGLSLSLFFLGAPSEQTRMANAPVERIELASNIGEIRTETLPDGTVVTLAARSRLDVAFSEENRRVDLKSGTALFEVASDPERPFSVAYNGLTASVLGTVFEVRESGDVTRVAVAEGRVEVSYPLIVDGAKTSLVSRAVIGQGQSIAASAATGLSAIKAIAPDRIAAWRR
ncbi:MAG: FecR domain-containing protein, partial [Pseudomonadota bacterium]